VMTEMGTDFDQDTAEAVINEWVRHGFGRHPRMCKPADLARGVTAMVSMPRGAQITELEIQPEAPIEEDYS
ncbi:short-chain dehydrogenase, partial [Dietzia schimae]|nr:short-chain dehydrogenase [Dietzia kunjamensis subsp. schimae]